MRLIYIILAFIIAVGSVDAYGQKRSSKSVQKERQDANKRAQQTRQQIEENKKRTRRQLNALNLVNAQLDANRTEIARLEKQISATQQQINQTTDSIDYLTERVNTMKANARQSLRNARTMEQSKSVLGMVFSSNSFRQAVKRIGYAKQFDKWRVSKTQALKANITLLDAKKQRLAELHQRQSDMLADLGAKQNQLDRDLAQSQSLVDDLKKQGKTLEAELRDRNAQLQRLDRELERIIAEEARIAAEQERKRIAEEKKRQEEEQRRLAEEARLKAEREKAEAEAAAERQRQEAAAQEKAQKEQEKAQRDQEKAQEKARRDQEKKAEKERKKQEKKERKSTKSKGNTPTTTPKDAGKSDLAVTKPTPTPAPASVPAASFAEMKGRLGSPIEGRATVVGRFGRSQHGSLSKVEIDNTGIDIEGAKGAGARAVCDGTVSSIFNLDGYHNIVMVRHGEYLTVYANIDALAVKKGDRVTAGQRLGTVYSDPTDDNRTILHFEVRHEREKLNPEEWVKVK